MPTLSRSLSGHEDCVNSVCFDSQVCFVAFLSYIRQHSNSLAGVYAHISFFRPNIQSLVVVPPLLRFNKQYDADARALLSVMMGIGGGLLALGLLHCARFDLHLKERDVKRPSAIAACVGSDSGPGES